MGNYRFMKPIDMPRGTHYGNNYWIFRSRKLGRRVSAFSNLEYENLITLEMNPEVEYYCEQPREIHLFEDGIEKKSIPDAWVIYKNGKEDFQEVKYSSELDPDSEKSARNLEQIRRERKWCEENGFGFQLRTENEIHAGEYYLRNLIFLYGHVNKVSGPEKRKMRNILDSIYNGISLEKVFESNKLPDDEVWMVLSELFYEGYISFERIEEMPLRYEMELTVNEKKSL